MKFGVIDVVATIDYDAYSPGLSEKRLTFIHYKTVITGNGKTDNLLVTFNNNNTINMYTYNGEGEVTSVHVGSKSH